jgi:outer membrane protein OmpA-like peptidoglycan-associated protein
MKNIVKSVIVLVLSLGSFISLTACSEQSPQEPLSAAIIIGSHANSRNLNFSNEVVVDTVKQAIGTYGLVSVICADGNPDLISSNFYDLQAIPDFYGITVSWHQIGDTANPQEKPTPEQRNQLISIWRAIIEKTGGIFETSSIVANPGDIDATDLPNVSAVQLATVNAPLIPQAQVKPQVIEPIIFSEEQVHFVGDKAIYVNATEAEAAIKPTAEFMLANPNFTALLVGTTAGNTSNDFTYKLSGDRAAKVRETLIKFDVPAERIQTIGLASSDPWHIPDTDNKGKMNENNATQNRKVVLLDLTAFSPTVKQKAAWNFNNQAAFSFSCGVSTNSRLSPPVSFAALASASI